jgi:hypothetical protein
MEYIVSGTTSIYYPTYMNPDNGAIYPPSTSTNPAAVRSTYAVGEAYATSVESYNYQQVSSWSWSPADAEPSVAYSIDDTAYSQWLATANMTDITSSSTTTNSSSASSASPSGGMSPLKIATFGVPAVVGFVLLVVGIWCCCRCRRRRRDRRRVRAGDGGEGGNGEMREVERQGAGRYDNDQRPQSLTRDEVMGVISSGSGSVRRPTPTQSAYAYGTQQGYTDNRRYLTPSVGGSRHSRWTDDSEFDVMAEDGSTITRTLSTTSTRRSGLTEIPEGRIDDNINPFDHPAYTYRAAPQQLSRGQTPALSRNGTLSSASASATWSLQSQLPPLSFQSTQSPISPLTPTAAAPPYIQPRQQRQGDTYSTHSSDDGDIYGTPRPGLRREPTIIRHSDSTFAQGRGAATVEKRGRDGVVELPPLYEDATSGWAR